MSVQHSQRISLCRGLRTALALAAVLVAMAAVAPASALAAWAWIEDGTLTYYAGSNEGNQLSVSPNSGSTYRLDDPGATITPASGCASVNANRVTCSSFVFYLYLVTGDGNDTVTVGVPRAAFIDGGSGNDTLTGGSSGDTLQGGTGTDEASYSTRTTPVAVTLDGTANDGAAGENDDVRTDVENVAGGSAGDTLTGSGAANVLTGGAGDDTLTGGAGSDTLDGGAGSDSIQGGDGNDTLKSRDGTADQVSCGAGSDSVTADPADTIAADCESVEIGAPAGGEPPADGSPGGGGVVPQAGVILSPGPVRVRREGFVMLPVTCGLTEGACKGTVTLSKLKSRKRAKAGRPDARSSRRSRPKRAQIGRARFSIAAGRTGRVKVRLSRNGRRRVLSERRLRCRASVETVAADGKKTLTKTTLTLLAPKTNEKK